MRRKRKEAVGKLLERSFPHPFKNFQTGMRVTPSCRLCDRRASGGSGHSSPPGTNKGRLKPVPPTAQVPGHRNAAPRPRTGQAPPMPRPPSFPMPLPAQAQGCRGEAPAPQGKPPPGTYRRLNQCRPGSALKCKGRSPLHKKNSPPSRRGAGGMGAKGTATAGKSGNRKSPPADAATALFPNAAPAQVPGTGTPPPAPHRASPAEYLPRRLNQCRPGSAPGDARGEAPCIRKTETPPSPEGRG